MVNMVVGHPPVALLSDDDGDDTENGDGND